MSRFWRGWFAAWCLAIGVSGAVLAGGAFAPTSAPVGALLTLLHGGGEVTLDAPLRFSLAVLGAVSLGWAVTLGGVVRFACTLGEAGDPLWRAITWGMATWFLIDSALSVLTGFGWNVVPNVGLTAIYGVGRLCSGRRRPKRDSVLA